MEVASDIFLCRAKPASPTFHESEGGAQDFSAELEEPAPAGRQPEGNGMERGPGGMERNCAGMLTNADRGGLLLLEPVKAGAAGKGVRDRELRADHGARVGGISPGHRRS